MIKNVCIISYSSAATFIEELTNVVDNLQCKGYEVEIQYSERDREYSALIIARESV